MDGAPGGGGGGGVGLLRINCQKCFSLRPLKLTGISTKTVGKYLNRVGDLQWNIMSERIKRK